MKTVHNKCNNLYCKIRRERERKCASSLIIRALMLIMHTLLTLMHGAHTAKREAAVK